MSRGTTPWENALTNVDEESQTSETTPPAGPRAGRVWWRWVPLGTAFLAFGVLAWVDYRLQQSPLAGYHPAEVQWTVVSGDIGSFWKYVQDGEANARFREGVLLPPEDWVLAMRKFSGITPSPVRWRVWLGSRFVAAGTVDGAGICVRPGLLLRVISALRDGRQGDRVAFHGDWAYGWRDGFLVVSRSRRYVAQTLSPDAQSWTSLTASDRIYVTWRGPAPGGATIAARPGLPVEGEVQVDVGGRGEPLTLMETWPESPVVTMGASDPAELLRLFQDVIRPVPLTEGIHQTIEAMREEFPEGWLTDGDEFTFALMDVDTTTMLPVPAMALMLRGVDVGTFPEPPEDALDYEWQGIRGWIRPWMGEPFTIGTAQLGTTRYVTSQEGLMAGLLTEGAAGPPLRTDAYLHLNWSKAGRILGELFQRAAEDELLPRMNSTDFRERYSAYFEGLQNLGTLEVQGQTVGPGTLAFSGFLARYEPWEEAPAQARHP